MQLLSIRAIHKVAALVVVAWLAAIVNALLPFVSGNIDTAATTIFEARVLLEGHETEGGTKLSREFIKKALVERAIYFLALCTIGLVFSLLSLRFASRTAAAALFVSCMTYLTLKLSYDVAINSLGIFDAYEVKIRSLQITGITLEFIVFDFFVPLVFALATTLSVVHLLNRSSAKRSSEVA
jgi:hypothetical protein